jgi:trehalose 6-phosphate phosphatase
MNNPKNFDRMFWVLYRERLKSARKPVLVLDFDGTVSPFVVDRNKAYPYPELIEPVKDIITETNTRVIICTGRRIETIKPLIKDWMPVEIWGSHGWEHLKVNGTYELFAMQLKFRAVLKELENYLLSRIPIEHLELKLSSIAVHWRGVSGEAQDLIKKKVAENKTLITTSSEIKCMEFCEGFEFRLKGKNKGTVIKEIRKSLPVDDFILYAGDDVTDEDAFQQLNGLNGVGVLVAKHAHPSHAQFWITAPHEVRSLLCEWKQILTEN